MTTPLSRAAWAARTAQHPAAPPRASLQRRPVHASVRASLAAGAALALSVAGAAPASAHNLNGEQVGDVATNTRGVEVETSGEGQAMRFVTNLQYDSSGDLQDGSDIEFMRLGKREFALAGTLRKGMQIINITDPRNPRKVAVYDCDISQGDIQVWTKGSRVLASYTADGSLGEEGAQSTCGTDLGLAPDDAGTFIVNLTKPANPRTVSFLPVERGSHNMTIHPSGNYLYNSNSDLITSLQPTVTIYDIRRPAKPRKVQDFPFDCAPSSLGCESHDITFNQRGTRAFVAALSQTLVLNTRNPAKPTVISRMVDPSNNVVHQADPVTLRRKNGTRRTFMIVTDERAGAAASAECPGGGLHVYDITKQKIQNPIEHKLGTWFIPSTQPQDGSTCTSHVLRIYPKQKLITIAWYSQGVRVISIAGLAKAQGNPAMQAFGQGIGLKEIGHYVMADSDTWSFKTNKIRRNGSFFGYGNDLVRGFDVYRFNGKPIKRDVKPLQPADLRRQLAARTGAGAARDSVTARLISSVAVVGPSLGLVLLLRRRSVRRG